MWEDKEENCSSTSDCFLKQFKSIEWSLLPIPTEKSKTLKVQLYFPFFGQERRCQKSDWASLTLRALGNANTSSMEMNVPAISLES